MKLKLLLLFFLIATTNLTWAGEINKTFFGGIAIEGYDPVAYFKEGKPQKGNPEFTTKWKGATWQFSSAQNRDLFSSNPEAYSPQFGGHCANGLSEGHKVSGNPKIWRLINGKLYFFFAERGRERWASNTDQWISDAQANWEKLKYD